MTEVINRQLAISILVAVKERLGRLIYVCNSIDHVVDLQLCKGSDGYALPLDRFSVEISTTKWHLKEWIQLQLAHSTGLATWPPCNLTLPRAIRAASEHSIRDCIGARHNWVDLMIAELSREDFTPTVSPFVAICEEVRRGKYANV